MAAQNKKRNIVVSSLLATLGLGLVVAGGFVLYSSLTGKKTVLQAPTQAAKASTKKRTTQEKAAYTVPSTHPRMLVIPKLGIDAAVVAVGAPGGVMAAPGSAWDAGWYDKSSLPGSGSGALLIDGHVNDALNSPGVFYNLSTLKKDDEIIIERGDGRRFAYSVSEVRLVPLQEVDMNEMLTPAESGKEGVNLITCGGTYNTKKQTYDHRVLVFAVRS